MFHWSRDQNPPYIQSLSSPQPRPQHSSSATTSFINIYFKLSIPDINFFGRSTTVLMLPEMSCDNVRSIFCSNLNNMYYVKYCVFHNNFQNFISFFNCMNMLFFQQQLDTTIIATLLDSFLGKLRQLKLLHCPITIFFKFFNIYPQKLM